MTTKADETLPTLPELEKTVTAAWQQHLTRRRPAQQQQAHKVSNVKRKEGDPQFQQQQG